MNKAARKFGSGDFNVRVPVRGNDEVAELAKAFNNMADSLANLETARNTFMANVAHDLRTPMTTISGFIDNLLIGAIPKENEEYYLGIIKEEVKRLSRLVSSLLDITRLQAGDRKLTMVSFDICELARLILISFEQKIDAKKLNVEFECDEERMLVSADRDAIYQILYNICDNAVKFSSENGTYRIRIENADKKKVVVRIYNTGEGIAPDDLPHIFERFYKADKSRGIDKNGVGLGMYIARTIVEAHGEKIWVESKHHESCEFFFTLPKELQN
jgi:signal transduction histidine kinase